MKLPQLQLPHYFSKKLLHKTSRKTSRRDNVTKAPNTKTPNAFAASLCNIPAKHFSQSAAQRLA